MRVTLAITAAALSLSLGCSSEEKPESEPTAATPIYEHSKEVSTVATVTAIDLDRRQVTLKGPQGNTITCVVDDRVRNLPQLQVGDRVAVTYKEATAVEVVKKTGDATESVVMERAPEGEKPQGKYSREASLTAEVVAIDQARGTVSLKGSSGEVTTVTVRRPERLSGLKVGDILRVSFRESVAMSVEPVPAEVR